MYLGSLGRLINGSSALLLHRLKAPTVGALIAYVTHMDVGNAE